jgi:hypothetical protein
MRYAQRHPPRLATWVEQQKYDSISPVDAEDMFPNLTKEKIKHVRKANTGGSSIATPDS